MKIKHLMYVGETTNRKDAKKIISFLQHQIDIANTAGKNRAGFKLRVRVWPSFGTTEISVAATKADPYEVDYETWEEDVVPFFTSVEYCRNFIKNSHKRTAARVAHHAK